MRSSLVLVVALVRVATAQPSPPTPPADPCAGAAFRELEQLQARFAALEAAGGATLADILDLLMASPTSYAWQAPGSERFHALFTAQDLGATRPILAAMQTDFVALLGSTRPVWGYRCEAYPTSHQAATPLTPEELAARKAIAKTSRAAHARDAECERLQARAFNTPEEKRHVFAAALDRCHRDLTAARERCERDFAVISRTDGFAPYQASLSVSNIIELRGRALTADDVAAVRRRVGPVLDALRPPLSSHAAPARAALARKDPSEAVHALSGALKVLYSPCEALYASPSRCIVHPGICRPELH